MIDLGSLINICVLIFGIGFGWALLKAGLNDVRKQLEDLKKSFIRHLENHDRI